MKLKFLFTLYALLFVSVFATQASFPVERTSTITTTKTAEVRKATEDYSSPAAAGSGKSQVTALILVALVGGLGIHRFYLGYTWQGIVQLLTLGGCGVWSLIDLIRIITGDLKPKNGAYSKTL
ncbi:MAG: TM2 domain-containing protein [Flavobacterium sp.]|jgi:TM2 domain-containing membrane protein YozV|uniref:TM2 domain-containing protein n=1 Tax=Flavobacterium aureirubrum TaxID=3133147 RepID=A0ABU9N0N6_9FLAO|nr:TM2 domain-containing protein [Flavobacterium sp.]MCZ8090864.1 TM2 domain-containing protein [Flavobacterium sp.]MCZ8330339.1 TM2 domain-containing protein [Flavobacterium sp.]